MASFGDLLFGTSDSAVSDATKRQAGIDKTYEDAKSYYTDGDAIVFDRSLGIKRNAVVLPAGYRLASVNVPVQVLQAPEASKPISCAPPVSPPSIWT